MTRREQVLDVIRAYGNAGISAINIAYTLGAPRSTVRRETQALRASGAIRATNAGLFDIDRVLFVAAEYQQVRVATPERYFSTLDT